jgi:hypothetical protein
MGAWSPLLSQPSVHDAAVVVGMVNEAASQSNKGFAVALPAVRHLLGVRFRISIV